MRSGLFIRATLSELLSALQWPEVPVEVAGSNSEPPPGPGVRITAFEYDSSWVFLDSSGDEAAETMLVELLVQEDSGRRAIKCRIDIPGDDFFFELVEDGRVLEGFHSAGRGWDVMEFTSEVRKVPAQQMLDPERFLLESLSLHGLVPRSNIDSRSEKVALKVGVTPRSSGWLRKLLGAAWPGE